MKHFGTDVTEGVRNVTEEPTVDPSKVKTVKDGVLTIALRPVIRRLSTPTTAALCIRALMLIWQKRLVSCSALRSSLSTPPSTAFFAGLDKASTI